jgi:hypothetical protein
MADVQILAARRVWTDKSRETVDPDRTREKAVWLPATIAVQVPLSKADHAPDGTLVVELGAISPERVLHELRQYDPELITVGLRVTARLVGEHVSPARAPASHQIDLAMGD